MGVMNAAATSHYPAGEGTSGIMLAEKVTVPGDVMTEEEEMIETIVEVNVDRGPWQQTDALRRIPAQTWTYLADLTDSLTADPRRLKAGAGRST